MDYTDWGDGVAYEMREYYEANRPLRWWETRNPPGSWGCVADDLMIGLMNIALSAERERRSETSDRYQIIGREERLEYERQVLAAEVEWVSLAKFTMRFCDLMERNTQTLDAALCLANARAEREGYDRLVVEGWMPMLLALKETINQNDLFPQEYENPNRLLSEDQPRGPQDIAQPPSGEPQ